MTPIIDLATRISTIEVAFIMEPWAYRSHVENGSDEGRKLCVYSSEERMALYVKTRHQRQKENPGRWTPDDLERQYQDTPHREIVERRTVEAKLTLRQQLEYLEGVWDEKRLRPGEVPTPLFTKPLTTVATLPISEWDKLFAHLVDKPYTDHIFTLLDRYERTLKEESRTTGYRQLD